MPELECVTGYSVPLRGRLPIIWTPNYSQQKISPLLTTLSNPFSDNAIGDLYMETWVLGPAWKYH